MNYPKALRVIRAAKGISQQDLAKQAGLSKSLISKIEAGARALSETNKNKLAKSIDIPSSLFEILALEPHDSSISKRNLETIGASLLKIKDEIAYSNEKTL